MAGCLFFEPSGRPGPGRDGFGARAAQCRIGRRFLNPLDSFRRVADPLALERRLQGPVAYVLHGHGDRELALLVLKVSSVTQSWIFWSNWASLPPMVSITRVVSSLRTPESICSFSWKIPSNHQVSLLVLVSVGIPDPVCHALAPEQATNWKSRLASYRSAGVPTVSDVERPGAAAA